MTELQRADGSGGTVTLKKGRESGLADLIIIARYQPLVGIIVRQKTLIRSIGQPSVDARAFCHKQVESLTGQAIVSQVPNKQMTCSVTVAGAVTCLAVQPQHEICMRHRDVARNTRSRIAMLTSFMGEKQLGSCSSRSPGARIRRCRRTSSVCRSCTIWFHCILFLT